MGLFHHDSQEAQAHSQVYGGGHKAALSHELIAAAASYEAAKAYEQHVAKNGQPPSHEEAKKLFAAFAGAAIDHLAETKGLNFVDKEKAKHDAQKGAESQLAGQF